MDEFELELMEAARQVRIESPDADFCQWCELLMRRYPAEIVDALGADEREAEAKLKIIWRILSPVERV